SDVAVITPPPPTCTFNSATSNGGGFDLTWSSTKGTKVSLGDGSSTNTVGASETRHVNPDQTTTYVLSVDGASGSCSRSITLQNQAPPLSPPPVCALTSAASPNGGFDLSWTSSNAATAALSDGSTTLSSDLNSSDPLHVDPASPTVYVLT